MSSVEFHDWTLTEKLESRAYLALCRYIRERISANLDVTTDLKLLIVSFMGLDFALIQFTQGIKGVFIGESGVGKTSILLRFVKNEFVAPYSTIGAAFLVKQYNTKKFRFKFELWDFQSRERFHSLSPLYYRQARIVHIVYDITDKCSYDRAKIWLKEIKHEIGTGCTCLVILIGNKIDLDDQRQVSKEEAEQYAFENEILFYELSAKTGENVFEMFHEIAPQVCQLIVDDEKNETVDNVDLSIIYQQDINRQNPSCC